mgnify:CR=1 FL=1|tara:strand:- start:1338 stop:2279 length:942 start_codon:yes stop_codon:yes gene_type:complete
MVGLNRDQIRELHLVIENYHLLQINSFVGFDYLYSDEQAIVQDILGSSLGLGAMIPHIEKYYKLGIIRAQNPDSLIDSIDWREMDRFLSNESRVIDLNTKEKDILSNLKSNSYSHIKNLGNRAIHDLSLLLSDQDVKYRAEQEAALQSELLRGVAGRRTVDEITRELAAKAGDWSVDWARITSTELSNAEAQGVVAGIVREHGEDAKIYMDVQPEACSKCIGAYLTAGRGSRPIVFSLKALLANGSNVGRKSSEYLPVIPAFHPSCKCTVVHFKDDFIWNNGTKAFDLPKEYKRKIQRKSKVKITIGNKTFEV